MEVKKKDERYVFMGGLMKSLLIFFTIAVLQNLKNEGLD